KEAAGSALVAPQQTSPSTEPPKAELSRAEPPTGLAPDARGASGEATGASGTAGASGTSVVSGASGAPGPSAVSDTSGVSGASGVSGVPGVPGASKTSEASGDPGVSGASGVSGPPGVLGASGVSGVSAVSGTSGVSGVSGVSGTSGSSGSLLGSGGAGSSTGSGGRGRSLEPPADLTIPRLTEDEIKCVTRNFSTVLGEGGFGKVYKGEMRPCGASPNGTCRCPQESRDGGGGASGEGSAGGEGEGGGRSKSGAGGMVERDAGGCKPIPVAVKVLAPHSFQGDYEFMTELVTFGAVRHGNIVELLAYSPHPSKALVYEYMPNGDVHALLARCKKGEATFPWAVRLKVAHEVAQAVAFMHSLRYIHRDLKASNVLLTQAVAFMHSLCYIHRDLKASNVLLTQVGGCAARSGHVHAKSDVYAFGVFLVELLTGKSVLQDSIHEDLIPTLLHHDHPDLALLVDPAIAPECRRKDALAVAYIAKYALIKEWDARPSMQSVAQKIGNVVKWQKSRAEAAAAAEAGGEAGDGAAGGGEAGGGEGNGVIAEGAKGGTNGAAETPGAAAAAEIQSIA
ncbi:unnamed protein product, partial [Closterium sp. Naga37s-1]